MIVGGRRRSGSVAICGIWDRGEREAGAGRSVVCWVLTAQGWMHWMWLLQLSHTDNNDIYNRNEERRARRAARGCVDVFEEAFSVGKMSQRVR